MSIEITCDKCKAQITGAYVDIVSDFWELATKESGQLSPTWCAHGDNFIMCVECYDGMIREMEG